MSLRKTISVFAVFFALMFIVTVIQLVTGKQWPRLAGAEPKFNVAISLREFLRGRTQIAVERKVKSSGALRGFYIRLRNQLRYSFFGQVTSKKAVRGKNDYLFEKDHLQAHLGLDCLAKKKVKSLSFHSKQAQVKLAKYGVKLKIILAPGKGHYYREHIPEDWSLKKRSCSNYYAFINSFRKSGVEFIDYNAKLLQYKAQHGAKKIYTRLGTHWSQFAATLIGQDLLRALGLPAYRIIATTHETHPRYVDADIFNALNLLWSSPKDEYYYAKTDIEKVGKSLTKKPNVLIVADSFYMNLVSVGISKHYLSPESEFWYYNKQSFPNNGQPSFMLEEFRALKRIKNRDYIILLVSEVNLKYYAFGFLDRINQLN